MLGKIVYVGDDGIYAQEAASNLAIPKPFVENYKIRQVLYATIDSFSHEEQKTILLRYWLGFSVKEVVELTKSSPIHIICVLALYLEKLKFKIIAFSSASKDAAHKELVYVEELFEAELWEQYEAYLLECEKDPEYKIRFNRTKEAFLEVFSNNTVDDF